MVNERIFVTRKKLRLDQQAYINDVLQWLKVESVKELLDSVFAIRIYGLLGRDEILTCFLRPSSIYVRKGSVSFKLFGNQVKAFPDPGGHKKLTGDFEGIRTDVQVIIEELIYYLDGKGRWIAVFDTDQTPAVTGELERDIEVTILR